MGIMIVSFDLSASAIIRIFKVCNNLQCCLINYHETSLI